MFNKQLVNQYVSFLKGAGYKYSKDNLGFYFDNGINRYSIMKTGPMFQCYCNKKTEVGWVLKSKSNAMLEFGHCLQWVLDSIQKEK